MGPIFFSSSLSTHILNDTIISISWETCISSVTVPPEKKKEEKQNKKQKTNKKHFRVRRQFFIFHLVIQCG